MSNTRYLEFDSTYRNRIQYPEPADFTVEISQSGTKGQMDAINPISFGSPILWWNSSFTEGSANTSVAITGITVSFATSSPTTFLITAASGDLRNVDGFYNGAILSLYNGTNAVRRRITDYKLITATQAQVTVESAFPDPLSTYVANALSVIENPTNNTATATVPQLFIPAGKSIDNFYVGYTVQQYTVASNIVTVQTQAVITAYDGITHLATLDANTSITWLANLNFSLRKTVPLVSYIYNYANPVGNVGKSIQLNLTTSSPTSDTYKNCFLRMIETSSGALPAAPYSSTTVNLPFGEERRIVRYIAGDGTIASVDSTKTIITLGSGASQIDGYYVNAIISNTTRNIAQTVIAYNGSNQQATLSGALTGTVVGDVWSMRTAIIESPFSVDPNTGAHAQSYEIEFFTRDNAVPFAFLGSLGTTQEMVCYEVELLNLILPNSVLKSGRGGRPIFHPYMYVELQQVSASSAGNKNIICSNNPNSTRMLFRAVIDDTTQPVYSPFIKVDSDGMTHVIKFKPSDSFHFSVHHPGGDLFKTVATDTTGGTEPNPLVQISACFTFKKV